MSEFKREVRYTVIKHSQLTESQMQYLKGCIFGEGIPTVEAVVVEADWPEYQPVWKMIEDRVTGAPVEGGKAEYDALAAAMTTNQTIDGVPRELLERCARVVRKPRDETVRRRALSELRALLDTERCTSCDGSGDLVDLTGEWRGYCVCPVGIELKDRPAPDSNATTLAKKYDDTLLPFLALMRKELHANAGKGDRPGWLSMTADTCMLEIIYHFGKLQASVKRGDGDGMAEYGADVANLCMMLLDICGVINLVRHAEQPAPVAVVLPERREPTQDNPYLSDADHEWNSFRDELKRVNPSL